MSGRQRAAGMVNRTTGKPTLLSAVSLFSDSQGYYGGSVRKEKYGRACQIQTDSFLAESKLVRNAISSKRCANESFSWSRQIIEYEKAQKSGSSS